MKIIHINEHLEWAGGVETYLLSLIPLLEERGCQQGVVYASGRPELVRQAHLLPALSQGTKAAEKASLQAMQQILETVEPDIVHLHQVYNTAVIEICLQHRPVVVHAHDYRYVCPASSFFYKRSREVCHRTAGLGCFTTTLTKHCLTPRPRYAFDYSRRVAWFKKNAERFSQIIAPSESARLRFIEAGFNEGRVRTLPYFCPLQALSEPRTQPRESTITFIGRIAPNKGIDVFIKALGILGPDVHGLIVGNIDDVAYKTIISMAKDNNCNDRLELQSWASRGEMAALYERTTVFVFPSLWPETLGIVGIEALAHGVPVVAADVGGVTEWCFPDRTGKLVAPGDAVATAKAISGLLADPALMLSMGRQGIELVRSKFSLDYHLKHLVSVYEDAVL